MNDYWGGGQLGSPQAQAIAKMKREDPQAYADLMQPAKRWWAWLLSIMLTLSVGWMIVCAVAR